MLVEPLLGSHPPARFLYTLHSLVRAHTHATPTCMCTPHTHGMHYTRHMSAHIHTLTRHTSTHTRHTRAHPRCQGRCFDRAADGHPALDQLTLPSPLLSPPPSLCRRRCYCPRTGCLTSTGCSCTVTLCTTSSVFARTRAVCWCGLDWVCRVLLCRRWSGRSRSRQRCGSDSPTNCACICTRCGCRVWRTCRCVCRRCHCRSRRVVSLSSRAFVCA